MKSSRIVLETSPQKKATLAEVVDLQGETLAEWFDEQVLATVSGNIESSLPDFEQLADPAHLCDQKAIYYSLSRQDWAFTDDDTKYFTHDLHPYPAKFIPQIPAHLISRLSMPGDVVCDPFGGSATTAVEAVRLRRRAVSFDANPLSELIGRVKTGFMSSNDRLDLDQLLATVESHMISLKSKNDDWVGKLILEHQKYIPEIPNHEKWFSRHVTAELALLKYLIDSVTSGLAMMRR